MPRSAPQRATNDWNSFQRQNKGKWDRDELIRRWKAHKHQQDAATPVSGNSRPQQLLLLKQGIQALILSGAAARPADDVSGSNETLQAKAGAHQTQGGSPARDSPDSSAALCSLYVSCSGTPDAAQPPNKQNHQQQAAHEEQLLQQTPDSQHTARDASATATTAAPPRSIDISPCSAHTEPDRLSDVPVHELVKLREAVHHLLSKQTPQPQHQHHEQQPISSTLQPLQQDRQQDSSSSHAAPAASQAAEGAAVGMGCFGRGWGSSRSKLSWNAFQKSCKGRGLTQAEISAAYRDAKQQYLLSLQTGQDPPDVDTFLQQWQHQHQQQQKHTMDAVQPNQRQAAGSSRWSGLQQWLHSRAGSRAASRACSTAVSPSSSPAGAALWLHPLSQGDGRQQGAVGGTDGGHGGKWGALKEWLHSRSSSRAASRLGTPSASPAGPKQQQLPSCSEGSCQQTEGQQQHPQQQEPASRKGRRQPVDRDSPDADASYLPFANQLAAAPQQQLQQQVGAEGTRGRLSAEGSQQLNCNSSQQERLSFNAALPNQQQPATPTHPAAGSSASSGRGTAQAAAAVVGPHAGVLHSPTSSSLGDVINSEASSTSTPEAAASAAGLHFAVSRPAYGAPIVAAASAATATSRAMLPSAVAAACPSFQLVGHRLARETVPDDMPGLLQGFSEWLPVVVGHIKELKRAVPQLPGLYEWGVKLPLGSSGSCSTAGLTPEAAGTTATAQQQQQQKQPPAQLFGPVIAFYLGRAGTLKPQRPRRRGSAYGQLGYTGETLRSRLTNYWAARSGRLGPLNEEHKTAFFQQQLQAGGRLYLRWRVCDNVEPVEAETYLLNRIDWAANYMNNRGRRPLTLPSAELTAPAL